MHEVPKIDFMAGFGSFFTIFWSGSINETHSWSTSQYKKSWFALKVIFFIPILLYKWAALATVACPHKFISDVGVKKLILKYESSSSKNAVSENPFL